MKSHAGSDIALEHVNFTIHHSKRTFIMHILEWICAPALIAFFDMVVRGRGFSTPHLGLLIALLAISFTYSIASGIFWEIIISGDEIFERTLLSRKTLAFHKLQSVEGSRNRIIVKAYSKEMTKAHPKEVAKGTLILPTGCVGYEKFVARLREANISGAEMFGGK